MKSFPMFIRLEGRKVVIAGGGEEAVRKLRLMLKTEASITVMADEIDAGNYRIGRQRSGGSCERDLRSPRSH